MIKFTSLSIRNFLSYGNNTTTISLEQPGTTLIVGEDIDNTSGGQGANGVGKSAIINALTYALYDKPVSNISKDNLVNNINKKKMEVTVEFIGNDGNVYRVVRCRKMKAGSDGNTVHLFINGEDKTPSGLGPINEKIQSIIGVPYELFVRIVVFSASHMPFLDLPSSSTSGANQRDIIEELFGLTMLSQKAGKLKFLIKDTDSRLQIIKAKIEAQENEQKRHTQQVESSMKRVFSWEQQNQSSITDLQVKLKKVEEIDLEEQKSLMQQLKNHKDDLTATNEKIKDCNQTLKEKQSVIFDHDRIIKELKKQIVDHTATQKTEQQKLNHLQDSKCPFCQQTFVNTTEKIKECEVLISECDNRILECTSKIKNQEETKKSLMPSLLEIENHVVLLKQETQNLTKLISEISGKIVVDNIETLMEMKNESKNIKNKITELENAINPYIEPLDELSAIKFEPIEYEEINKITKLHEHQTFLLKLLTKQDSFVRKALLNKNIPYLNTRLQHYLSTLGLPHKVEFTHQMTAKITQFGHDLDFGNLSAGQKARVNIALSFAFKDVLQQLHSKINICLLDEVLDIGLDTIGVQAAAKLIKKKARDEGLSLYVISHRDEIDGAFDKTMTIQLKQGFSYIKDNGG